MLSTLTELLGFAALTAGAYVVGGLAAALFTAGGALLVVGYALEDDNVALKLRRVVHVARGLAVTIRQARGREQAD